MKHNVNSTISQAVSSYNHTPQSFSDGRDDFLFFLYPSFSAGVSIRRFMRKLSDFSSVNLLPCIRYNPTANFKKITYGTDFHKVIA